MHEGMRWFDILRLRIPVTHLTSAPMGPTGILLRCYMERSDCRITIGRGRSFRMNRRRAQRE